MGETLKRLEPEHGASGSSCRDAKPAKEEIAAREQGERAENHDCTEPMQLNLVKVFPLPPGRLNEHARPLVGLIDLPLDARRLAQQCLLVDDARIGIDRRALLLRVDGRGEADEARDQGSTE